MIKLIDLLLILEEKTRIKTFIDNDEIGVLYHSPLSSALMKKKYYTITNISINNNRLILKLKSKTNQNSNLLKYETFTLSDILNLIDNKIDIKIIYNNTPIFCKQTYLHHTIKKITIYDNILNIILK